LRKTNENVWLAPDPAFGVAETALGDTPRAIETYQAILDLEGPYRPGLAVPDIPVDLLTSSGSGLDPHISVAAAGLQAPRITEVRGLPLDRVRGLIDEHTQGPGLGFLGQERVNVLELNLALERAVGR
jgi:K+-transporting ATPase ATPase C chain